MNPYVPSHCIGFARYTTFVQWSGVYFIWTSEYHCETSLENTWCGICSAFRLRNWRHAAFFVITGSVYMSRLSHKAWVRLLHEASFQRPPRFRSIWTQSSRALSPRIRLKIQRGISSILIALLITPNNQLVHFSVARTPSRQRNTPSATWSERSIHAVSHPLVKCCINSLQKSLLYFQKYGSIIF